MMHFKLSTLSNVEATLYQRCKYEVVVSTLLQRCGLVVRRCDLTTTLSQRCVFESLSQDFNYIIQHIIKIEGNVLEQPTSNTRTVWLRKLPAN